MQTPQRHIRLTPLAVSCIALIAWSGVAGSRPLPNTVIIHFRGDALTSHRAGAEQLDALDIHTPGLRTRLGSAGVRSLRPIFPWFKHSDVFSRNQLGEPIVLEDLTDYYVADVAPDVGNDGCIGALRGQPDVLSVEADEVRTATTLPNDPQFTNQWWLNNTGSNPCNTALVPDFDINAPEAWNLWTGISSGTRIGILDTGVQSSHPDLSPRVQLGTYFYGTSANDDNGHGTAVAGIVTASGNNSAGVSGVCWGVSPVSVKVLDGSGSGSQSNIAAGIDWARTQGIPILNLSLGGPGANDAEKAACHNAWVSGILVVVAMGNENSSSPDYPAGYGLPVWAIGALYNNVRWRDANLTECSGSSFGSNTGSWIDISAPGGRGIATTQLGGGYFGCTPCSNDFGGTSAATPVVSGVAGLLKSRYPTLAGEDISQIMIRTARDITSSGVGWDSETGYGLVRADAALNFLQPPNALGQFQATSLPVVETVSISNVPFFGCPGIPTGNYYGTRYRLSKTITFGKDYLTAPDNWLRNSGTRGTDAANPHVYAEGNDTWAFIVPGTLTATGCTVQTFVYDLTDVASHHVGWYPTTLAAATIALTTVGPGDATPPATPGVSTTSNCTDVFVSWNDTGDDGTSGQATAWEMRSSSAPIDATNWSIADLVTSGAPGPNGTPHTVDLVVGECSPRLYYGVRLQDNAGNWSGVGSAFGNTPCIQPPAQCENGLFRAGAVGQPEPTSLALGRELPGLVRSSLQLQFVAPSRLRNQDLSLDILDVSGRSVRRWSAGRVASEGLNAEWDLRAGDGRPVPAGVYFLRAQLGPQLLTRRFIVLR